MVGLDQMQKRGRFAPKDLSTLRPAMFSLIGEVFTFDWAGVGDDDGPYAGQNLWMICRDDEARLNNEQKAKWVPDEDIQPLL